MLKIFIIPLEIAKDPLYGGGYTTGVFGSLVLGVWLVRRKRKVSNRGPEPPG